MKETDMGKFLKKNWFIVVIVAIFICISTYYIYDTNKGKLKGKKANGQDVVFNLNNKDTSADSLYDEMYRLNGKEAMVALFKRKVADDTISTTSAMKDIASSQKKSIISNYEQRYGKEYEAHLRTDLQSSGFTDLEEYLINTQKIKQIAADYAKKRFDELKIRQISYILIKFEDKNKPSEKPSPAMQKKMDEIDAKLKANENFADVAAKYTEDTTAVANKGRLGIIDKNTSNLDSSFLETSLALNEAEVSKWIYSKNFGFFKIKADATKADSLASLNPKSDPYLQLVSSYDNTLNNKAIWEKANTLGIDFAGHKDIEKDIKSSLGIQESEKK